MKHKKIVSAVMALAVTVSASALTFPTAPVVSAAGATVIQLDPSNASPFNDGKFEGWGTSMGWWGNRIGHSDKMAQQAAVDLYSEEGLSLDIVRYNVGGGDNPSHNHVTRSDSKLPCFAVAQYEKVDEDDDENNNIITDFSATETGLSYSYTLTEKLEGNDAYFAVYDSNNALVYVSKNKTSDSIDGDFTGSTHKLFIWGGESGMEPVVSPIVYADSKTPGPKYDSKGKVTNFVKDENGDVVYTWNWNADKDQLNVLKRIKEQNDNVHIEGYTNSPPWFMTNSQCSSGGDDTPENLDPSNYDVFANFLAEVAKHMKEDGLAFDSYSPMNEPEPKSNYWRAMSPKQEGNLVAPGANQSGLLKATKDAFKAAELDDIIVAGLDETDLGYTISSFNALTADGKASLDRLDTHTYGGSNRAGVRQTAIDGGKNLWMSEVDGNWNGFGLADRIITDLNGMQASAWVLWDLVDFHKDSTFKDPSGNKTEANASLNVTGSMWGMGMGNHDTETIEWANKYYAYGQFTRYINPGDTLIASSNSTLAAYNRETGDIKIVVNNGGSSDVKYDIDLSAFTTVGSDVKEIRSNNLTGDNAEHWKEINGEATLTNKVLSTTAKAGTITTYVISGAENFEDDYAIIVGGGNEIQVGASAELTLNTTLTGSVEWSVSNGELADIVKSESDDKAATVTAKASGTVTVYAKIGDYTASRTFVIPMYKLSGTPSWGNDSNAPADSADYRKAADGDLSTYFDGNQNGWVMYDYSAPFKVSEIQLAARDGHEGRTVGAKIQGSNDAITWTDLYTIPAEVPANSYTTVAAADLANNKAYRYYRYTNPSEMTNIAEFLIDGELSDDIPEGDPVVTDIKAFTDDFESTENIFSEGNVFDSELERFGKVFAPNVGTPAKAELGEAINIQNNQLFRLKFNVFSGYLGNDTTTQFFALKDAEGNDLVSYSVNLNNCVMKELKIGGENVLDGEPLFQCRSNMSGKTGANGWNASGQPFRNNMGHNIIGELLIDGSGSVSVSFTGGLANINVKGTLDTPVSVKSIVLTSNSTNAGRSTAYDNFDGDLISYGTEFVAPTPSPSPSPTPIPTPIPKNTGALTGYGNSGSNSGEGILIATGDESKGNLSATQYRAPYIEGETGSFEDVLGSARIGVMEFSINPDVNPEELESAVLNIHVNSVNGNLKSGWTLLAAYETENPTLTYKVGGMDDSKYLAVNDDYSKDAAFWTNEHISVSDTGWRTMNVTKAVKNALKAQAADAKENNTNVKVVLRFQMPTCGLNVSTTGDNTPYIALTAAAQD